MSTEAHALDHHHHENDSIDVFGFWLYIMTDCVLFASLFAAFLVLHFNGAYGPAFKPYIELPYVLGETFFLLASNLTFGMAMICLYRKRIPWVQLWLVLTVILGAGFVGMEVNEFVHMISVGYSPEVSASASAFFTLVGTHGCHVSVGLIWITVMIFQVARFGITPFITKRLTYLGLFWNFLDIVWIFLFTVVYLMGAM